METWDGNGIACNRLMTAGCVCVWGRQQDGLWWGETRGLDIWFNSTSEKLRCWLARARLGYSQAAVLWLYFFFFFFILTALLLSWSPLGWRKTFLLVSHDAWKLMCCVFFLPEAWLSGVLCFSWSGNVQETRLCAHTRTNTNHLCDARKCETHIWSCH